MKLKEYKYKINGIKFTVGIGDVNNNEVHVEVNGTPYTVELDRAPSQKPSLSGPVKKPQAAPRTATGEKVISTPVAAPGKAKTVKSPLPGTIMSIAVREGDTIKAGDTVCVLEAMKMENDVHSISGGKITKILVNVGDTVLEGADLMVVE